jgi:hypothetical protein
MGTPGGRRENHDPELRKRMRLGRLQQITERIDRVESELADIQVLVLRMQQDESRSEVSEPMRAREPSVTSTCWEPRPMVQEDSASL